MIDVSVVIAAFNAESTVCDAVASALEQIGVRVEVLVGDDASTDSTFEKLQTLKDDRVRVFRMHCNCGPGAVRDFLIQNARGEFVAFLDADDRFLETRLFDLVQVARAHPGSLVFDDISECHDSAGRLVPFRRVHGTSAFSRHNGPSSMARTVTLDQLVQARRLLIKPLIPMTELRRTGARHTHHRYGEDGLFLWTLLARGVGAIYVPEPRYLYRITRGSLSANPERISLLADCLASLAREDLSPNVQRSVDRRVAECRAYARVKAFQEPVSFRKVVAAIVYICGGWDRLPRLVQSYFQRGRYHASRILAGAPRR